MFAKTKAQVKEDANVVGATAVVPEEDEIDVVGTETRYESDTNEGDDRLSDLDSCFAFSEDEEGAEPVHVSHRYDADEDEENFNEETKEIVNIVKSTTDSEETRRKKGLASLIASVEKYTESKQGA